MHACMCEHVISKSRQQAGSAVKARSRSTRTSRNSLATAHLYHRNGEAANPEEQAEPCKRLASQKHVTLGKGAELHIARPAWCECRKRARRGQPEDDPEAADDGLHCSRKGALQTLNTAHNGVEDGNQERHDACEDHKLYVRRTQRPAVEKRRRSSKGDQRKDDLRAASPRARQLL